jgi:nucleotide-binding universal stress UspA family protein
MKIVCATDFSSAADQATRIAVSLARALAADVELFHVVQLPAMTPPEVFTILMGSLRQVAEAELDRRIEEVAGKGVRISRRVEVGLVDETLAAYLEQTRPSLLVLGSHGRRGVRRFLGSVAERMLRRARCPVLVVPDGAVSMRDWAPAKRSLRITAGIDLSVATLAMTEFLGTVARATPCALDLVHLYWPPREQARLGLPWAAHAVEPDPSVPLVLERELRNHLGVALEPLGKDVRLRMRPAFGGESDPMLAEACAQTADVIALGNNLRESDSMLLARVRAADIPVLCVPVVVDEEAASRLDLPPVRTVLVATDFSPFANAALAHAYRMVAHGGAVVICHIADPGPVDLDREVRADLEKMLASLVPPEALASGIRTQTVVHASRNPAEGIVQVLRRTGADAVVMASHGRSGLRRAVLGSVAEGVIRTATKPVLVVPSAEHQEG